MMRLKKGMIFVVGRGLCMDGPIWAIHGLGCQLLTSRFVASEIDDSYVLMTRVMFPSLDDGKIDPGNSNYTVTIN